MRMRISDNEIQYYAKAKRDGATVRLQGMNWRVSGVTADTMGGAVSDSDPTHRSQYWVELAEA